VTIKTKGMGTAKKVTNLCRLAHVLRKEGDFRGAEEKYSLVLEMDPGNVYALVGMGDLRRREKQFEKAVQYYQRSLVIEKKTDFPSPDWEMRIGDWEISKRLLRCGPAVSRWILMITR
jgi:tetratricopeptide (TPR) repeat protein